MTGSTTYSSLMTCVFVSVAMPSKMYGRITEKTVVVVVKPRHRGSAQQTFSPFAKLTSDSAEAYQGAYKKGVTSQPGADAIIH